MCRFTAWSSILLLPTAGAIARPVFGQATAQPTTVPAAQVATLHTFDPRDFQESRIDRLSGGLTQQIPFRMVADSQGRILVTDPFLSLVHVFDTKTGRRWQINGDRLQRMNFPTYVAVDAD